MSEEPVGVDDTERCIEIPWASSCYNGEARVLDVGYAYAEERYIEKLLSLQIPQLYGIDIVKKDIDSMISVVGDVRNTGFPDDFFDLIFCISAIEHIGRDNSIYYSEQEARDELGDLKTIVELERITKKGGKMILTAPFGKYHDYGWFIHYDERRWNWLLRASNCRKLKEDFFIYKDGWRKSDKDSLKDILYKDRTAPAAAGLVCAMLIK
ncbi:MAG: class I SAM-dependent methyltransferase [Methanotrichaceae archaeon]|nr:class I SAM-dependent methyltransferase [Methanotrichaceae archaeon]